MLTPNPIRVFFGKCLPFRARLPYSPNVQNYTPVDTSVGVDFGGVAVVESTLKEVLSTVKVPNFPLSIARFKGPVAVFGLTSPRKKIVKSTIMLPLLRKKGCLERFDRLIGQRLKVNRYNYNLLQFQVHVHVHVHVQI